jgi:hypothetical protein
MNIGFHVLLKKEFQQLNISEGNMMELQHDFKELFALFIGNNVETDNLDLRFLGRNEIIKNKKAIGRPKDLSDIDQLMRKDLK